MRSKQCTVHRASSTKNTQGRVGDQRTACTRPAAASGQMSDALAHSEVCSTTVPLSWPARKAMGQKGDTCREVMQEGMSAIAALVAAPEE